MICLVTMSSPSGLLIPIPNATCKQPKDPNRKITCTWEQNSNTTVIMMWRYNVLKDPFSWHTNTTTACTCNKCFWPNWTCSKDLEKKNIPSNSPNFNYLCWMRHQDPTVPTMTCNLLVLHLYIQPTENHHSIVMISNNILAWMSRLGKSTTKDKHSIWVRFSDFVK